MSRHARGAHHDDAAQRVDRRDAEFGIESMCVAGGMGQAMLVQRIA
jgi:hypothetical protein